MTVTQERKSKPDNRYGTIKTQLGFKIREAKSIKINTVKLGIRSIYKAAFYYHNEKTAQHGKVVSIDVTSF